MRLTVGSLPPAVYWRRRAVVLGVLLVAVLILWSSCSGPSNSDAGANRTAATSSPAAEASAPASSNVLTPTIGSSEAAPTSVPPVAPQTSSTARPPCADADLQLVAATGTPTSPNGAYLKVFLRVKNISSHACTRDLGADHQELYLQSGTTKIWSSDACNPNHGGDVVTMEPNIVHEYNNWWTGLASNNGCANRKPPGIGKYELFARLDTKISEPATVQLT